MRTTITRLKHFTDERFADLGRKMAYVGLTPNRLSLLGIILTGLAASLFTIKWLITGTLILFLGAAADAMDGIVARASGTASKRGGFLDSVLDRYSDIIIFGAIMFSDWLEPLKWGDWEPWLLYDVPAQFWVLGALTGALLTSYARAAAERLGVGQEGIGLIERPERLAILAVVLIVARVTDYLELITWVMVLLTLLGHYTVIQRAVHFWKEIGPPRPPTKREIRREQRRQRRLERREARLARKAQRAAAKHGSPKEELDEEIEKDLDEELDDELEEEEDEDLEHELDDGTDGGSDPQAEDEEPLTAKVSKKTTQEV